MKENVEANFKNHLGGTKHKRLMKRCRAPLHECPKYHGHKGDLGVTT
jgi:hypothetical protein